MTDATALADQGSCARSVEMLVFGPRLVYLGHLGRSHPVVSLIEDRNVLQERHSAHRIACLRKRLELPIKMLKRPCLCLSEIGSDGNTEHGPTDGSRDGHSRPALE